MLVHASFMIKLPVFFNFTLGPPRIRIQKEKSRDPDPQNNECGSETQHLLLFFIINILFEDNFLRGSVRAVPGEHIVWSAAEIPPFSEVDPHHSLFLYRPLD